MSKLIFPALTVLLLAAACGPGKKPEEPPTPAASETPPETPPETPADTAPPKRETAETSEPDTPETDVAVLPPTDLLTTQDESWYFGDGWSGEYPDGFSIEGENVVLMGRASSDLSLTAEISCPLDQNVTIHQWNEARVADDGLNFVIMNKIAKRNVIAEGSLEAFTPGEASDVAELALKPGDQVEILRYLSEGYGIIRVEGHVYEVGLQDLVDMIDGDPVPEDRYQWVQVTCDDEAASRAWLLYSEAMNTPGVIQTPIEDFGSATDLGQ